jgi:hypothetical protein
MAGGTDALPCLIKPEELHTTPGHLIARIGGTNVASTLIGGTITSLVPIDCLYVQRLLLSVCLRRRRKNLCKSALYTEEMRYLDRFVP